MERAMGFPLFGRMSFFSLAPGYGLYERKERVFRMSGVALPSHILTRSCSLPDEQIVMDGIPVIYVLAVPH